MSDIATLRIIEKDGEISLIFVGEEREYCFSIPTLEFLDLIREIQLQINKGNVDYVI